MFVFVGGVCTQTPAQPPDVSSLTLFGHKDVINVLLFLGMQIFSSEQVKTAINL